MKQLFMLAQLVTETDRLMPVFLPLMNISQRKNSAVMLKAFTLDEMNAEGWQLTSIEYIRDDKEIPHQVAIFTKN